MGLVRSLGRAALSALSGIATPERWVEDWFSGGIANSSGVRVDADTALTYSPFFAGVRVISEDLGSLPLFLYQRLERGKDRARGHRLYELLRFQPNPMMSSQQLRETLQGHALTWGNGVAQVVSDERSGAIEEIWPLRPDRLTIKAVRSGPGQFTRAYLYHDDVHGIHATLLPHEVLHIAGLGFDGVRGYDVVAYAANSIGLGLATEHHGARFFANGSAPGGVLTHPGVLSPGARKRMAADWENMHKGIDRAHRVAILEEGVTWQQIGIPHDSAQFLETRKLQVTEMARWLRLPSHKINDLERATFSNIEHQQVDYVTSALRTWLERWEQAIYTQLLLREERELYYAEHLVDALLRGDTLARYQAYAVGRQWGWLSANDVRDRENLNPINGGDAYLVPLNMVPAGRGTDPARAASVRRARLLRGRGQALRASLAEAYAPKFQAADERIAELEADEVGALVAEHLEPGRSARSVLGFLAALQALYAQDGPIAQSSLDELLSLITAYAADVATDAAEEVGAAEEVDLTAWSRAYTLSHIAYRIGSSFGQLRKIAETGDDTDAIVDDVLARLAKWQAERPDQTARWETSQVAAAASREAWREAGVAELRWVAQGSSTCPYCTELDGRTVAIEQPFIAEGDELKGEEEGETLTAKRNTFHPPVHPGCDCQIVPVIT